MSDQMELDWLVQERPQPLPLDSATTARVRADLLARGPRQGRRRRWRGMRPRTVGLGVSGATLAAAAAVVLVAGGQGGPGVLAAKRPGSVVGHHSPVGPLTRLSVKLADETSPVGDATLVLRTQKYPDGTSYTGADLYADDGDYFYSPTLAGLPAAIKAGDTVNLGAADQEVRDIAAAKAALTGPIDQARKQMSVANLDPGVKPTSISPGQAPANAPAALRRKIAQAREQAKKDNLHSVIGQEDGMIWDNGMDALLAGAGDPQVRAGVLKLFATIPQITVTNGTLNGQPTLQLTASLLSSNPGLYQEELILNADTGVPLEMIGGNQGQTPSVTVDYTVTRTTLNQVQDGSAG